MEIVVGDVVTGENLHGRDHDLDVLWDRIRSNSILLSSPRRFGKTSLVRHMQRCPHHQYEVVYMDVEGVENPEDFVFKLAGKTSRPYRQQIIERLTGVCESVEELEMYNFKVRLRENKSSWQETGNRLFEALTDKTIVVLDELPEFLLTLERTGQDMRGFMAWLREIRQTYGTRFILCGSVSIDGVLDRHTLGNSINDLERITVPPFDLDTALCMIELVLDDYKIVHASNHAEMIVSKIGVAVPYFVQLVLRQILEETDYGRMELTDDMITRAYRDVILGDKGSKYFRWYLDRLKIEFPHKAQRSAAKRILDHVAIKEPSLEQDLKVAFRNEPGSDPSKFNEVIKTLKDGFYIQGGSSCTFTTKAFRDWWARERRLDVDL